MEAVKLNGKSTPVQESVWTQSLFSKSNFLCSLTKKCVFAIEY